MLKNEGRGEFGKKTSGDLEALAGSRCWFDPPRVPCITLVWGCVKGLDDLPILEAKSNLIGAKTVPLPHSTCWELLRNFADSIVSILWSKWRVWWITDVGVNPRASFMAQTVKNLPAIQENRVWSLGWEDPLKEGMATHSSILAWRIPMDRGAWQAIVHGVAKSPTWVTKHSTAVRYLPRT